MVLRRLGLATRRSRLVARHGALIPQLAREHLVDQHVGRLHAPCPTRSSKTKAAATLMTGIFVRLLEDLDNLTGRCESIEPGMTERQFCSVNSSPVKSSLPDITRYCVT